MEEKFQEELKLKGKEHKKQLLLYRLSKMVENFGIRSFWLFYNNIEYDMEFRLLLILILAVFRFVIRVIPCIFLYGLIMAIFRTDGHILIAIAMYVAMYLGVYGLGYSLRDKFELKISLLRKECSDKLDELFSKLAKENNITRSSRCDEIAFENGIVFNNEGEISAPAPRQNIHFKLYNKTSPEDCKEFYDRTLELPKNEQTMEKNIASIDFNKKFAIILRKSYELDCMKYFSPTLQSQMVKSTVLPQCYNIEIEDKKFSAKTPSKIERPIKMNLFTSKPIISYFKETEEYCKELATAAKKVYNDLSRVEF